jgi:hypothetical protein
MTTALALAALLAHSHAAPPNAADSNAADSIAANRALPDPLGLAALPPASLQAAAGAPRRYALTLFYEDIEFGSLDSDVVVPGFGTVGEIEIEDVERQRVGAELAFGEFYVRGIVEEFLDNFDMYGGGLGVRGTTPIGGDDALRFGAEYTLGFDLLFGDGDVPLVGEQDLWYLDMEGKAGVAALFGPFRVSLGGAGSYLFGEFESVGETGDIEAFNAGLYLAAAFHPEDFPILARIEGTLGDIEGLTFTLGFAF